MLTNEEIQCSATTTLNRCIRLLKATTKHNTTSDYKETVEGCVGRLQDCIDDIKFALDNSDEQEAFFSNKEDYERLTGHEFSTNPGRV